MTFVTTPQQTSIWLFLPMGLAALGMIPQEICSNGE